MIYINKQWLIVWFILCVTAENLLILFLKNICGKPGLDHLESHNHDSQALFYSDGRLQVFECSEWEDWELACYKFMSI